MTGCRVRAATLRWAWLNPNHAATASDASSNVRKSPVTRAFTFTFKTDTPMHSATRTTAVGTGGRSGDRAWR